MIPAFMPVGDAAENYRIPPSTLYRWISDGTVAGGRTAFGVVVLCDSLEAHLRTRRLDKIADG